MANNFDANTWVYMAMADMVYRRAQSEIPIHAEDIGARDWFVEDQQGRFENYMSSRLIHGRDSDFENDFKFSKFEGQGEDATFIYNHTGLGVVVVERDNKIIIAVRGTDVGQFAGDKGDDKGSLLTELLAKIAVSNDTLEEVEAKFTGPRNLSDDVNYGDSYRNYRILPLPKTKNNIPVPKSRHSVQL